MAALQPGGTTVVDSASSMMAGSRGAEVQRPTGGAGIPACARSRRCRRTVPRESTEPRSRLRFRGCRCPVRWLPRRWSGGARVARLQQTLRKPPVVPRTARPPRRASSPPPAARPRWSGRRSARTPARSGAAPGPASAPSGHAGRHRHADLVPLTHVAQVGGTAHGHRIVRHAGRRNPVASFLVPSLPAWRPEPAGRPVPDAPGDCASGRRRSAPAAGRTPIRPRPAGGSPRAQLPGGAPRRRRAPGPRRRLPPGHGCGCRARARRHARARPQPCSR